ncbi:MAG TPA: RNA polymerase sigma-54 factor [Candidatus Acidoferrales bacterium]|nr:RNA polymerase sigma-54 factor [Candidatus Acidoferrales bacterium]
MSWLQPKLHLKVSQKQILTPGLVQMVSVLALNRLELREMLNTELVANPVLEEVTEETPISEDYSTETFLKAETEKLPETEAANPFDEFDVSALYQYLDSGTNDGSNREREVIERPSFEKFLSSPEGLTDHLEWQLHGIVCSETVREIAETIIGNLDEDGYLTASLEEVALNGGYTMDDVEEALAVVQEFDPLGVGARNLRECLLIQLKVLDPQNMLAQQLVSECLPKKTLAAGSVNPKVAEAQPSTAIIAEGNPAGAKQATPESEGLNSEHIEETEEKLAVDLAVSAVSSNGSAPPVLAEPAALVEPDSPLWKLLQSNQLKEIARALNRPYELVKRAMDVIRKLDPRPGLRYNKTQPRLVEPDVYFRKVDDDWQVFLNEDDLPQLRLSPVYRRLLARDAADRDVRNYVKERFTAAIQLLKNIEQRKHTILRVCQSVIRRQGEFLDFGPDHLKPMMIKEVAEEVGVHPSTVSRAVASKYAHTPQGVIELRSFFSESVNGPEGGNMSLSSLKRLVKKMIEEEDSSKPLTDDAIAKKLSEAGIQVTRRTVAKYREVLRIPSTHQRRVKA